MSCDCVFEYYLYVFETNTICTLKLNFCGSFATVASIVDMYSILSRIDHNNGNAIRFDTDIAAFTLSEQYTVGSFGEIN